MLQQFVDKLRDKPPQTRSQGQMASLFSNLDGLLESLPAALLHKAGSYSRTCAYRDEHFEVLLLNWAHGSASPIHDHGGQLCWLRVLGGALQIDDYVRLDRGEIPGTAKLEASASRVLNEGEVDLRSGRFDLHRVSAPYQRAVSLHVYARPLTRYFVYDERQSLCEPVTGTYDARLPLRGTVVA